MKKLSALLLALTVSLTLGAFCSYSQSTTRKSMNTTSSSQNFSKNNKPNFAFPDKVAADAEQRLKQALDKGNGQEVVNSLVCYSLARNAISASFLPAVIERIDSVRNAEHNPCVKSLLGYLEAVIYNQIYRDNKWNYDRREIPADLVSKDYTEWSGEQFKSHISGLLTEALTPVKELAASPLEQWRDIIVTDELSEIFYPTLYDLIAYNSIEIYNQMASQIGVLPIFFLLPEFYLQPISVVAMVDSYSRSAHDLCIKLTEVHRGSPAPEIMAKLKTIKCLSGITYNDGNDTTLQTAYMDLYREYADTEWGAEALLADENIANPEYIAAVRKAIERFPNYVRVNALKRIIDGIEQAGVEFDSPEYVTPGKPFEVKLKLENIDKARLRVYRSSIAMKNEPKSLKITPEVLSHLYIDKEVSITPRPKPYSDDAVISMTLNEPGYYYIWTEFDGQATDTKSVEAGNVITCSDLAPLALGYDGSIYPYAVASSNGAPLSGVKINGRERYNGPYNYIGTTLEDGTITQTVESNSSLLMERGKSAVFCNSPWSFKSGGSVSNPEFSVYSSLPLYHHGDSVEWVVVAYLSTSDKYAINQNFKARVELFDANNQLVDSVKILTDNSGRASGTFKLPEEGISGNYWLRVKYKGQTISTRSITVNDYKMPTFEATITDIKRSLSADSLVTVTCKTESYSGFPIADAKVKVRIEALRRFWEFNRTGITFWANETTTDGEGNIVLPIGQDVLSLCPIPNGLLRVTFDVTSPAGETHSASYTFTTGKPYTIQQPSLNGINLDSKLAIEVEITDAMNRPVNIPLQYTIISGEKTVATIDNLNRIPSNIESGIYDIKIAPVDSTLANGISVDGVAIYRNSGISPSPRLMFIPEEKLTANTSTIKIPFGCSQSDANVLVAIVVDDKLAKREWFKPVNGMQYYSVDVPAECTKINILFTTIYDCNQQNEEVSITNERSSRRLAIEVESFRDKVVPGAMEQITLKVKENGKGVPASVIMAMQSKSILALRPSYFDLKIHNRHYPGVSINRRSNSFSRGVYSKRQYLDWPEITTPELQLYDMQYGEYAIYRSRKMNFGVLREHANEVIIENEDASVIISQDEATEKESATMVTGYATKSMSATNYDEGTDDLVVVTEENAPASQPKDDFNYRPSEIPLAFFAPMLSTDSDGSLTYTYTVPEANTAWVLKALAYTPDVLTSTIERTTIASRPVMVNATTPRFLRYGDDINLRATVMNNTDSAMQVETVMSILRADDMSLLETLTIQSNIDGHKAEVVTLPIQAPYNGQALIVRIKSRAGDYTDGEQSIVPLLPVTQPVITSKSFYVSHNTDSASYTFNGLRPDAATTLYLYDNPLWEVVTALPSLNDDESVTSTGAMNRIYMAAVAKGLMKKNPTLKKALADWLLSDRSDSTLTSMLNRNDDLKQLSINATPWVQDAMSDTERLSSLALMLEDKNLDRIITKAVKTLKECQMNDGGIQWCSGWKSPSLWATYRVLVLAASLKERGYMPDNTQLNKVVTEAIHYIDKDIATQLKLKRNRGDYTEYSYIRSMFKNIQYTSAAIRAISLTTTNILKRWETEETRDKGIDAIILYRNNYPSMARRIVASIKAYSISSPEKGTWWDRMGIDVAASLLYTIETVTPADRELIMSVAQWLIINKTNQAWDSQSATSATIDAILGAIDVNAAVKGNSTVMVNGHPATGNEITMPGMTVANISDDCAQGSVTIDITKNTGLPAMGSVISRAIVPMSEIESTTHPSVSIEKRYNVVSGTVVTKADTLKVGDRVKVQLVINVKDDLDYVTVIDRRGACMEPVDQLSGYVWRGEIGYYREMCDSETRYFFPVLPKGTYVIDTDMNVMATGTFASGVATLQSQLNPGIAANSSSTPVIVR